MSVVAKAKPKQPTKPKPKPKPARKAAPKPTAPSLPLPPPPPPPPAVRDELEAPRDVGRLLRYGERFGTQKIDVRWLPQQLPIGSSQIALCDASAPKSWRVLDRPVPSGSFRVMLSYVVGPDATERLAAVVLHVGRPPIARWTVAHYHGQKRPKSADQLPRVTVASNALVIVDAGTGSPGAIAAAPVLHDVALTDGRHALVVPCKAGEYAAYWAIDAADKPVCLVVDLDVLTQKEWKAKPA